jgi:hypothetical protein
VYGRLVAILLVAPDLGWLFQHIAIASSMASDFPGFKKDVTQIIFFGNRCPLEVSGPLEANGISMAYRSIRSLVQLATGNTASFSNAND